MSWLFDFVIDTLRYLVGSIADFLPTVSDLLGWVYSLFDWIVTTLGLEGTPVMTALDSSVSVFRDLLRASNFLIQFVVDPWVLDFVLGQMIIFSALCLAVKCIVLAKSHIWPGPA